MCPGDVVTTSNPVTWPDPVVGDNLDTSIFFECIPESGSQFLDGVTIVTCTATDDAGNMAMCTFSVNFSMLPILKKYNNVSQLTENYTSGFVLSDR